MQGRLQEIFSTLVVFPLLLVGLDCTCDGMSPHLSFKQNISSVFFETLNEYTHTTTTPTTTTTKIKYLSCLLCPANHLWLRSLPNTAWVRNTSFGGGGETLFQIIAWKFMIKRWNKNQTAQLDLLVLKFSALALFVTTQPLALQGRLLVKRKKINSCYQNPSW